MVINTSGTSNTSANAPAPFPRPVTEIDKARSRIAARVEDELAGLIEQAHENYRREQQTNNRG